MAHWTEPLRPLPSSSSATSVGCCWLNIFDGGYVPAHGFPVPSRKSGGGIELPFDIMVEQAMTYHTVSHRESIILKGHHTALVPILVDSIETIDQLEDAQWHLIGKKPKLVQVDLTGESKRIEGYYLTDVEVQQRTGFILEGYGPSWLENVTCQEYSIAL